MNELNTVDTICLNVVAVLCCLATIGGSTSLCIGGLLQLSDVPTTQEIATAYGLNHYVDCKGESADIGPYGLPAKQAYIKCRTLYSNDFCMRQCAAEEIKFINPDGTANKEQIHAFNNRVFPEKHRANIIAAMDKCIDGQKVKKIDGKCEDMAKADKCFRREFDKVCK